MKREMQARLDSLPKPRPRLLSRWSAYRYRNCLKAYDGSPSALRCRSQSVFYIFLFLRPSVEVEERRSQ